MVKYVMSRMKKINNFRIGFSIVELIVVISVIGILSAIAYVSYGTFAVKARDASVMSDVDTLNSLMASYVAQLQLQQTLGVPTASTAAAAAYYSGNGPNTVLKFTPNSGNVVDLVVSPTNTSDYCIRGYNSGSAKNSITNAYEIETTPGVCNTMGPSTAALGCPAGFIVVPGSSTYGTNDFCAMKYEAKADNNADGSGDNTYTTGYNTWPADSYPISSSRMLVSTAAGYPVVNVTQATAITASANYTTGCSTGCHLITEAEWMTLAQNVLSVASNWDNGAGVHTVGTGYIYSGHNDGTPANSLVADASDANGYSGTGQSSPSNQRRTLTLTNGAVIWDLAGNAYEWTSGSATSGQPGLTGEVAYAWKQWKDVTAVGTLSPSASPASTGLAGASGWYSANGVGLLYSNAGQSGSRSFYRSGCWYEGGNAGVLFLNLNYTSTNLTSVHLGLRVAR